jgi:hypothetical protein
VDEHVLSPIFHNIVLRRNLTTERFTKGGEYGVIFNMKMALQIPDSMNEPEIFHIIVRFFANITVKKIHGQPLAFFYGESTIEISQETFLRNL